MDAFLQDLRGARRALRARPGFVLVVVVTLALAIGANAAVFSVVHAVLLRQLPYDDPDRVVIVNVQRSDGEQEPLAIPDLVDYRASSAVALAGWSDGGVNLTGDGDPERLRWARAGDGFFEVLGARAALGRTFLAEETRGGGARVAVLGDALWRRRFAADPSVIGRQIALGDARRGRAVGLPAGARRAARAQLRAPGERRARVPAGARAGVAAVAPAAALRRRGRDGPLPAGAARGPACAARVTEAASIQALPMSGVLSTVDFTIEGRPPPAAGEVPQLHYRMIGPGLFAALGIPLLEGRGPTPADGSDAPAVVVVSRRLAERYFPGGGALGARLLLDEGGERPPRAERSSASPATSARRASTRSPV